ncbi:MAG: hypothetical protein KA422_04790 [Rhizobacter sp.]|nr:hypothetical protein [Rhizobacter sp.]
MNIIRLLIALVIGSVLNTAQALPSAIPPNIVATTQNKPMVMMTASKDFTMFWKAYTDFEDIDFDGKVDYTFKPAFSYYGYFDSSKCYTYSTANSGRFVPAVEATIVDGKYYCTAGSGYWSGNFLNWATMSRIDILRKVLYGGMRSFYGATAADRYANGDSAADTTLELSFVPRNSQAFVKYYNGSDLDRLTPFDSAAALAEGITLCRRPAENAGTSHSSALIPQIRVVIGNYILWNMTEVRSCNWSTEVNYTWQAPTITFLSANYVSPNGVKATSDADYTHKASVPTAATNGATYSGGTLGPTFTGRVQACVADKLDPGCKQYGAVYKPTGLLHEFGESSASGTKAARAEFALMMGSYDHNLEAGVLRKNMGEINDEINPATGQFKSAGVGKGGIVQSLNEINLYGYDLSTGQYSQTCQSDTLTDGNCSSWGNPVGELLLESTRFFAGKAAKWAAVGAKDLAVGMPAATNWVDPLSTASDDTLINGKKRSELYGRGICRPLNMLTISGGVNSYDDVTAMLAFTDITNTATAEDLTKKIGDTEGITGTKRLVGNNGVDVADLQCTGKTVSNLGKVQGACPDGPNFRGTYLGSGVAHFNNTNRIRGDLDAAAALIPDFPYAGLTVRNYGVTMSGGVATIEVPLPGQIECSAANKGLANPDCMRVYITPASLDSQRGAPGPLPGNMVDFKVLETTIDADGFASGSALVLWQHSMLGEDQDQDMLNSIRWVTGGTAAEPTLTVYTQAVESNTGSAAQFGFGYTLVGTDKDGLHMHSGINKFLVVDPTGVSVAAGALYNGPEDATKCVTSNTVNEPKKLCSKLGAAGNVVRGETYKTFNMTGATNASLKEPLWYIAKYGGFSYTKNDKTAAATPVFTPTRYSQWDRRKSDGTICNDPTQPCDGNPDNYFYARRPDLLEKSLREILEDIVTSSNTAPAISASQLQANDLKVVASFDAADGSGALTAYALKAETGEFEVDPDFTWRAHERLSATLSTNRQIITNRVGADGVPFEWASLDGTEQDILKDGGNVAHGQKMLDWIRGSTTFADEFRPRPATSIMGPIVSSNPTIQTVPEGRYFGDAFSGYDTFATTWKGRRLVLWAGAGDGMLHAFDASNRKGPDGTQAGGAPIMSYIPQPLFSRLPEWASANGAKVQAFVDGSPFVGDVKVGADWRTYLFSSLGRGGKGIFALDVTQAGTITTDTKGTETTADDTTSVVGSQLDQAHATTVFAWQMTDADDPDGDMGYMIAEPTTSIFTAQPGQIAMMNNGRFAALFGNGIDSTSGRAALYIVFADADAAAAGGKFKKIVVPTLGANGLSQPTWVDVNNDRIPDYIYAGDLQGNLWRFDVRSADPGAWRVSYFEKPLFTAKDASGNALPITGAPEFRFHRLGGIVVNVVTGKSVTSDDFPNGSRTNGMFGIWDKPAFAVIDEATDMEDALPRDLSDLEERELHNVGTDTQTRYLTGDAIDWNTKLGWYFFFNVNSEMGLNNLTIANNQVLTITVSPAPPKTGAATDACSDKPVARLLAVDPITGLPNGLLGTTDVEEGDVTTTYQLVSVPISDQKGRIGNTQVGAGGNGGDATKADECSGGSLDCTKVITATGGANVRSNLGKGRIFWREIPGFKTN